MLVVNILACYLCTINNQDTRERERERERKRERERERERWRDRITENRE